jgi:hypothetical protein
MVEARNAIQTDMLHLFQRWPQMKADREREYAVGIAFSLWRAVSLVPEASIEAPLDTQGALAIANSKDPHGTKRVIQARKFLKRVIEANAIGFADDDRFRTWTAGYYVNNAMYRTYELWGQQIASVELAEGLSKSLRDWWNWAWRLLRVVVEVGLPPAEVLAAVKGTLSGTPDEKKGQSRGVGDRK